MASQSLKLAFGIPLLLTALSAEARARGHLNPPLYYDGKAYASVFSLCRAKSRQEGMDYSACIRQETLRGGLTLLLLGGGLFFLNYYIRKPLAGSDSDSNGAP